MVDWVHHPDGCVHPVHLFTKLGPLLLTKSRGFPAPYYEVGARVPGILCTTNASRKLIPLRVRDIRGGGVKKKGVTGVTGVAVRASH